MKKTFLFSLAIAFGFCFASCGGDPKTGGDATESLKDDKLSSFMLAGVYFIEGYGGQTAVNGMITADNKAEIVDSYKQLLILPFKPEDGTAGPKSTLKSMWDISNKEDLVKTLGELKTGDAKKSTHKAWDYARLVNNACMGYAAGYLSAEETEKYVAEVLPLAKQNFKTWQAYYDDFNAGRKAWGGDPEGDAKFATATADIQKGDKSIYQLLPLN
ncbi:MAG: DUF1266 domain-containing protein [Flavobacterium sp.]|nr:MAG: DUF1266 domain-containing protein [Flavobacterium sp.]